MLCVVNPRSNLLWHLNLDTKVIAMVIEELSKLDDRVTSKAAVLMKYPGLIISRDSLT